MKAPAVVRVARDLSALAALAVAWQVLTAVLSVPTWLLPQPTVIWRGLVVNQTAVLHATERTLLEAVAGFVFGNLLGLLLATGFAGSPLLKRSLMPVAIAARSVPLVAIAPLLTLIFGFGALTIVVMASLICFFPAVVNGTIGLRSVQPEALALFRAIGASRWTVFWRLRLPSALPQLFAAFKVSAPASVLAAMIAEWLAANGGLGYLILDAADSYRFTLMWAGVAAATLLAVVAFALVNLLERRIVNWPIEA